MKKYAFTIMKRRWLIGAIVCCLGMPGCITYFSYRTFYFLVLDGDTGKPITAAQIKVWHENDRFSNRPEAKVMTDKNGHADVKIGETLSGVEGPAHLSAWAPGYDARTELIDDHGKEFDSHHIVVIKLHACDVENN
jgi:hypothetical protein